MTENELKGMLDAVRKKIGDYHTLSNAATIELTETLSRLSDLVSHISDPSITNKNPDPNEPTPEEPTPEEPTPEEPTPEEPTPEEPTPEEPTPEEPTTPEAPDRPPEDVESGFPYADAYKVALNAAVDSIVAHVDSPPSDLLDAVVDDLRTGVESTKAFSFFKCVTDTDYVVQAAIIAEAVVNCAMRANYFDSLTIQQDFIECPDEDSVTPPEQPTPDEPTPEEPDIESPPVIIPDEDDVINDKLIIDLMAIKKDGGGVDPNDYDHVREIGPGAEFDPNVDAEAVRKVFQTIPMAVRQDESARILLLFRGERVSDSPINPPYVPDIKAHLAIATEKDRPPVLLHSIGRFGCAGAHTFEMNNIAVRNGGIGFRTQTWVDAKGWAVGNVLLKNVAFEGSRQDAIQCGYFCPTALHTVFPDITEPKFVMEDMLLRYNGQGNTKHNCYVYGWGPIFDYTTQGLTMDSNLRIVCDNVHSYGANGAIAMKIYAPHIHVKNSHFATKNPSPGVTLPYYSQVLIDTGSCFKTALIEDSTFDAEIINMREGNGTGVSFRARRGMYSCALPPATSAEYLGTDGNVFWQSVRDKGDITPEHPDAMVGTIKNCKFTLKNPDNLAHTSAIRNFGTAAISIEPNNAFAAVSVQLPKSDLFVERSCVLSINNTFEGYPEDKLFDMDTTPWLRDPETMDLVKAPIEGFPPRKVFIRNTEQDEALQS